MRTGKTLQQQYGLTERQCFICRKSPKGPRFQLIKDGPKLCEACAQIARSLSVQAAG